MNARVPGAINRLDFKLAVECGLAVNSAEVPMNTYTLEREHAAIALPPIALPPTPTATQPDKPMLLIVDDQSSNLQLLYEIFKDDYEVCMAMGGQETLAFCQRRQPDLILLDIVMPEMGGYAVCQQLKSDP